MSTDQEGLLDEKILSKNLVLYSPFKQKPPQLNLVMFVVYIVQRRKEKLE